MRASTSSTPSPTSRATCSASSTSRSVRPSRSCARSRPGSRPNPCTHTDAHAHPRHHRDRSPLRRHRHRGVLRRRAPGGRYRGIGASRDGVAGINSAGIAGDRGPAGKLDVGALGYRRTDGEVRYYSYAADGGPYVPADTLQDPPSVSGHLLADQLHAMQRGGARTRGRPHRALAGRRRGRRLPLTTTTFATDPHVPPDRDRGHPLVTAPRGAGRHGRGSSCVAPPPDGSRSTPPRMRTARSRAPRARRYGASRSVRSSSPTCSTTGARPRRLHLDRRHRNVVVPATNISIPAPTRPRSRSTA